MCNCDQKLRIKNPIVSFHDISYSHRIHVMNINSIVNLVSTKTKVATLISRYDVVAKVSPLGRGIKALIQIAIESESRPTDGPMQSEVIESINELAILNKLGVRPNRHTHRGFRMEDGRNKTSWRP